MLGMSLHRIMETFKKTRVRYIHTVLHTTTHAVDYASNNITCPERG